MGTLTEGKGGGRLIGRLSTYLSPMLWRKPIMAKAKPVTLDALRSAIASKSEQLTALQKDLDDLKGQARDLLSTMAGEFGLTVGREGGKRRVKGAAPKTSPTEIADWLRATLAKGSKPETELRAMFANTGLGQRLRLSTYSDVVKIDKSGNVSLTKG